MNGTLLNNKKGRENKEEVERKVEVEAVQSRPE